jgi:hypothetical protein
MNLQTVSPIIATATKFSPVTSVAHVDLQIDMNVELVTVTISLAGHSLQLLDTRAIPQALLTALQAHAKTVGEALLGVANGSTTVLP